ncbi:P-loop containing nucleoside triphosphate hydrolase [Pseudocohnilembus persalinus]|uniref:p-loop containing nucleoside triphosphate hydrolase n=1 Tax=Pseudocohnilembus persalinus TaxID=266149 RepID=A0A0V0QI91_PSEPJ|nr:P-loop containing nucleoside triphosphate hydrolase [Pseudocohnilembus persalinus]|eukprot:KRX01938.1 P-loop containing nucleoside triphosphate hydrolase [Pseudocohnilembus persalinus]
MNFLTKPNYDQTIINIINSDKNQIAQLNQEKLKIALQITGVKIVQSAPLAEQIFQRILNKIHNDPLEKIKQQNPVNIENQDQKIYNQQQNDQMKSDQDNSFFQSKIKNGENKDNYLAAKRCENEFQCKKQELKKYQINEKQFKQIVGEQLIIKGYSQNKALHYYQRILLACEIIDKKCPLIILLGGTSGTGKSTAGSILAARFGISTVLSTDTIRQILRNFMDEKDYPPLFISTYQAGTAIKKEYFQENSKFYQNYKHIMDQFDINQDKIEGMLDKEKALKGYKMQCEVVQERLFNVIKDFSKRREPIVIEGVHLTPQFMIKIMKNFENVKNLDEQEKDNQINQNESCQQSDNNTQNEVQNQENNDNNNKQDSRKLVEDQQTENQKNERQNKHKSNLTRNLVKQQQNQQINQNQANQTKKNGKYKKFSEDSPQKLKNYINEEKQINGKISDENWSKNSDLIMEQDYKQGLSLTDQEIQSIEENQQSEEEEEENEQEEDEEQQQQLQQEKVKSVDQFEKKKEKKISNTYLMGKNNYQNNEKKNQDIFVQGKNNLTKSVEIYKQPKQYMLKSQDNYQFEKNGQNMNQKVPYSRTNARKNISHSQKKSKGRNLIKTNSEYKLKFSDILTQKTIKPQQALQILNKEGIFKAKIDSKTTLKQLKKLIQANKLLVKIIHLSDGIIVKKMDQQQVGQELENLNNDEKKNQGILKLSKNNSENQDIISDHLSFDSNQNTSICIGLDYTNFELQDINYEQLKNDKSVDDQGDRIDEDFEFDYDYDYQITDNQILEEKGDSSEFEEDQSEDSSDDENVSKENIMEKGLDENDEEDEENIEDSEQNSNSNIINQQMNQLKGACLSSPLNNQKCQECSVNEVQNKQETEKMQIKSDSNLVKSSLAEN